jgi:hypothetical protein
MDAVLRHITVPKRTRANDWISGVGVDVRDRAIDPVDPSKPHFGT